MNLGYQNNEETALGQIVKGRKLFNLYIYRL